jgi:hypothetical protein
MHYGLRVTSSADAGTGTSPRRGKIRLEDGPGHDSASRGNRWDRVNHLHCLDITVVPWKKQNGDGPRHDQHRKNHVSHRLPTALTAPLGAISSNRLRIVS